MQTMPSNLQGKGVVEVSDFSISQICAQWKNKFLEQRVSEESEFEQFSGPNSKISIQGESSPVDSGPTSTLDTTRRSRSPSPPTTSGAAAQDAAVLADPACSPALRGGSDNVLGSLHNVGCGTGALGLEEWESMFPNGEGALLPWIMGESDDLGLGLKHLLQSGNPVDYEGNAGLGGVVDEGSGLESLSPPQPPPPPLLPGSNLGFSSSGCGNNGKIGSVLVNSSSGALDSKVSSNGLNSNCPISTSLPGNGNGAGVGLGFPHPPQLFDSGSDEKPQILNPSLMMNPHQAQSIANPSFFIPPLGYCQLEQHLLQPHAKRHNPGGGGGSVMDSNLVAKPPFFDPGHEFILRQQQIFHQVPMAMGLPHQLVPQPKTVHKQNHYPLPLHYQQQEQSLKDQLFKAADLIQTGNFSLAHEILARLNHHQPPLPSKSPLVRATLYVKEALQMLLLMSNPVAAPPPKTLTPFDVLHKMNAYKVFSEVSPISHFVNFTCTQAILEVLDDAESIHVIDFDIGCGAQWASLIQELPLRKTGAPSLKITAIAPLSTTNPFELTLVRENLVQFANDVGVAFELRVVDMDSFDLSSSSMPNVRTSEDEAVAVSIPIWASSHRPSVLPSILRFIRQRSPKIVFSFDRGFDRCDTPFPQHLIHTLESCTNFLESLDGLNVALDVVNKVEKLLLQPRIENTVLGRVHVPDKIPHWKTLFSSAGLSPLQFSNFTETQADYVVKRTPGRGFHVEKRQASLVLSWQRRELVSASAWRF